MLIGYARVSTDDQNLSLQRDALNKAGCKRIFTDKASGAPTQRPGLADALSHLRKGDSLVVWKLDRLGRSVKGLVDLVGEFETRQVHFRSLTDWRQPIKGITPRLFSPRFEMLSYEALYHSNFGPPLLDPGAGFSAPVQQVSPFNERAVGEVADWQKYREPTPDLVRHSLPARHVP